MQPLKGLVIVMGILIAVGMAVVGYTIVKRAGDAGALRHVRVAAERSAALSAVEPAAPYGPVSVALPPGARILRAMPAGRRLIVELGLADGGERILVLELENGALLGTIDLKAQP